MTKLKQYFNKFLALNDTPERIALGFAVGVFISFSPLLGFHTVLGVFVAVAFGLNRAAVITGLWVNNPWTLLPFYSAATYLGRKLIGFTPTAFPPFNWHEIFRRDFWIQVLQQWPILKPLAIGSIILAVFASAISYMLVLYWMRQLKSRISPAGQ
jgi:uncharacterized protein